jgi:ATP-dependent RNA helicase HelY
MAVAEPSLFKVSPTAFRKGFDTPDKIAFAQVRSQIRSRVLVHQAFSREIGEPIDFQARTYIDLVDLVNMRLAFGLAQ